MSAAARPVRKAVIPAAGLGTRFLPATKSLPKEMLPVVDRPAIQYVVEECVRAGIDDILIITGRNKVSIEDHFDRSMELEHSLEASGKQGMLDEVRSIADLANVHFVRQGEPRGLGHAVGMGRRHVGDEPFVVCLPDDLMAADAGVLERMVAAHAATGKSVVALKAFGPAEISQYGVVGHDGPDSGGAGLVKINRLVEKPPAAEAPSDLAIMGRYLFTPTVFEALDRITEGALGELQLTDAMQLVMETEGMLGYPFTEGRYDTGNKIDYLKATVLLALGRPDLGPQFREFLEDVVRG